MVVTALVSLPACETVDGVSCFVVTEATTAPPASGGVSIILVIAVVVVVIIVVLAIGMPYSLSGRVRES